MPFDTGHPANGLDAVASTIDRLLQDSRSYDALPRATQQDLAQSMAKVFGYLAQGGDAPARQLAPDLPQRRGAPSAARSGQGPSPEGSNGARPGGAGAGPDSFQRASRATQELLGAISFPGFVASLVQGTFQAIVDSSIQQMEAYAQLLTSVAKSVDEFMADNITDGMARDHLANNYGDVFRKDIVGAEPRLRVDPAATGSELPGFLRDLGFASAQDIDEQALETVVVPETRKTLAEMRHQSLATMVMMGINRVVVQDGEINAKLIFHVDASESFGLTFNEQKPTNWTLSGAAGRMPFAASGILVTTSNINTQSDVNVRADLTGEVKIRFRSDYFPLERFADSAAIQLINQHAKVPVQLPKADPNAPATPPVAVPPPAAAVPPPPPPAPRAPAAQAMAMARPADDPWMPRRTL